MLSHLRKPLGAIRRLRSSSKATSNDRQRRRNDRLLFEQLEPRVVLNIGPVVISEFMADNATGLTDEDGQFSDWIEIFNPTDADVDLTGWYLTDSLGDLKKWQFPELTIGSEERRVVFASNKDRVDPEGPLHTNFKLSSDGEYLALIKPDGKTVSHEYAPAYPAQAEDVSYGVIQGELTYVDDGMPVDYHVPRDVDADLGTAWTVLDFDRSAWGDARQVLITEVNSGVPDYFEIQNVSVHQVDTTGWFVAANAGTSGDINRVTDTYWALPSSMAPGQLSFANELVRDGGEHDFGGNLLWGTNGNGWVMIVDAVGQVIDFVAWGYDEAELQEFSTTVGGFDVTVADVWHGPGVQWTEPLGNGQAAFQRVGNMDNNGADDFQVIDPGAPSFPGLGQQNPEMTVPFLPSPNDGTNVGLGFSADPDDFAEAIQSDMASRMLDKNASLWMRLPFEARGIEAIDMLTLEMQYNDGFVVYLNGQPIAGRNAPGSLAWNSTATDSRTVAESLVNERIDVSSALPHLKEGTNMLAIHGLNDAADDPNFLIRPRLTATNNQGIQRFFATPTPGEINLSGFVHFVDEPRFSIERGFFEQPMNVEISTTTSGATIYYTTDGSVPSVDNGTAYTGPIPITTTTTLRAVATKEGYEPTDVATHTYIRTADVATQVRPDGYPTSWGGEPSADYVVSTAVSQNETYADDFLAGLEAIPSLSLVLPVADVFGSAGLYSNPGSTTLEKMTSAEWILADGSEGFQINAGLKMQGGASRNPGNAIKHSMSLRFRDEYGDGRLDFPLFEDSPIDSFNSLQLRAMYNNSWIHWSQEQRNRGSMIRDQWMRDSLLAMGQDDAGRGDYVHLYINGLYWGVYNVHERQDATHYADYNGGDDAGIDAIKSNELVDGTGTSWSALRSLVQSSASGGITEAELAKIQEKLDLVNLIDYMIVNHYGGNSDWDGHNWRTAGGGTEDVPWRFYSWDAERVLEGTTVNRTGQNNGTSPSGLFNLLRGSPEFRLMFADRLQKHFFNDGALTPEQTAARWMARADQLEQAIVAESARWGDDRPGGPYLRDTKWIPEQNRLINTYFPVRSANVLAQYKSMGLYPNVAAPVFQVNAVDQHGGQILPDDAVTLTAPAGTIYYTLDGSDPRSEGALVFDGTPLHFGQTTLLRSRTLNGTTWSALNEATFYVGDPAAAGNLTITELNYHPLDPTPDELLLDSTLAADDFEFIELINTSDSLIDLTGVRLTDGVQFDFADSSVIALAPVERIVIAADTDAFEVRYGTEWRGEPIPVVGQYGTEFGNKLNNDGERITMLDRFGNPILNFKYNDAGGWPGRADGKGSSLEVIHTAGNYNDDDNWRSSSEFGGSPGFEGEGPAEGIVINEVLSRPIAPDVDAIELFNPTTEPIDVGGWLLSDTSADYEKFRIPDGTVIAGGQYLVFDEDDFNSGGGLSEDDFTLDGIEGGDVWLLQTDEAGRPMRFIDHVDFGPAIDGVSFGRWPNGIGKLVGMVEATLGRENSAPRVGAIVINEIHVDPIVKTQPVEYVELYNMSNSTIDLSGWSFTAGIGYTFPEDTTIEPGGYLLISENPDEVQQVYGVTSLGPFTGSLSNEGERIVLRDADGTKQDEVDYKVGFPWPTVGDAPGYSMELINPTLDNDLGGSWRASAGSPTVEETLLAEQSQWRYFKGTEEPSAVPGAWRNIDFPEADGWATAQLPIGYDETGGYVPSTTLDDMKGNYTTVYLRGEFQVAVPGAIDELALRAMVDDGVNVWINGTRVAYANVSGEELAHDATAAGTIGSEFEYIPLLTPDDPSSYLVPGTNVIAVQLLNGQVDDADAIFDAIVRATAGGSAGLTPGGPNSTFTINAPPQMRQVEHSPQQPRSGEPVTITVKVTDPDGVAGVTLDYQLVEPGDYIELVDPRYDTEWTTVTMVDDGTGDDPIEGDDIYTVVLPGELQTHRRLVRYRITVTDTLGASVRGPYADDPQPNFAYYVYDGVPSWTGAAKPGETPVTYDSDMLTSVPTYQLITTHKDHVDSQHIPGSTASAYRGMDYLWHGALVYDGVVYDHIRYRARGGVWRYAMGKNMWKFDFNRGHFFQAHDDYGNPYGTEWDKLNFSAIIQQGNFNQRGEQGLFEAAGFALHNLAGNVAPKTNYAHFRIVEDADENGPNQYSGDFQGLYLVVEQPDGRLLDEHGLPDGNLYKMEGGSGTLNNQGPDQPTNKSDLVAFMNGYKTGYPTEQWWEENLDMEDYYSFRAMAMAVHDYDIHNNKNYFYYHDPETDKWHVMNWDLDLCWTTTYGGGGGRGPLSDYVFKIPQFRIDYNSRVRELVDLLFNPEQTGMLLDEVASFVDTPGQPSIVAADRAMWDYNPIMSSSYVNGNKAGTGRYYLNTPARNFAGEVALLKNYVENKVNSYLAGSATAFDPKVASDEGQQPDTPEIEYLGLPGFPIDGLRFLTSDYSSDGSPFAAMEWRIAEVTDPNSPSFDPSVPRKYEVTSHWESGELTAFDSSMLIPGTGLQPGATYRVRARMKDADGRWSHWSDPVQFEAGDPRDRIPDGLRVTEIMYHPTAPTDDELAVDARFVADDFEFIELTNTSDTTIDLTGVKLRDAVEFDFAEGNVASLEPGQFVVVVHDLDAFAARYGTHNGSTEIAVAGQFDDGKLSNGGELITLLDAEDREILAFTYGDDGSWPGRADGQGSSLELLDTATDYDDPDDWRNSGEYGGSPGVAGAGILGDVVVNEVLSHTDPPLTPSDSIELLNRTDTDIDISGWYLSDSNDEYLKYRIPAETILRAGSYLVFDESHFNPTPETPDLGHFSLDGAHGDDVYLLAADAVGKPTRFVDHVELPAMANGESYGRWPNGSGELYPMTSETLRNENLEPRVGPLLISEVHYNPVDTDIEFVEVFNPTPAAVELTDWRISGGIDFDFVEGTTIGAQSTLVVVPFDPESADPAQVDAVTAFRAAYSVDETVYLLGPYTGRLDGDTDRVQLQRPDDPPADEPGFIPRLIEDEVIYHDTAPWPTGADGRGSSLNRRGTGLLGNDPASWTAAAPTPGSSGIESAQAEAVGGANVVGRYVFYNNSHFDGYDSAAGRADDEAIAADKQALLPGKTATQANYTNYSRGINGIIVDIAGLANAVGLSASGDFRFRVGNNADTETWQDAPAPLPIDVRPGEGTDGSDRITIRFDDNVIEKQWLEVTILPTPATGLADPDVFYFGNAIGEAGDQVRNTLVNATDEIVARNFPHGTLNPAAIDDPYDYNRDGLVNAGDQIIARNSQTSPQIMLRLIDLTSTEPALLQSPAAVEAAQFDWLREFEQANQRRDKSWKRRSIEQAVDQLLATDWF